MDRACGTVYVIIIDRAIDALTPLLHDFYYQPMIYDLLDINHNIYEYESSVQGKSIEKKSILNDYDDLFRRYKYHMPIMIKDLNI